MSRCPSRLVQLQSFVRLCRLSPHNRTTDGGSLGRLPGGGRLPPPRPLPYFFLCFFLPTRVAFLVTASLTSEIVSLVLTLSFDFFFSDFFALPLSFTFSSADLPPLILPSLALPTGNSFLPVAFSDSFTSVQALNAAGQETFAIALPPLTLSFLPASLAFGLGSAANSAASS